MRIQKIGIILIVFLLNVFVTRAQESRAASDENRRAKSSAVESAEKSNDWTRRVTVKTNLAGWGLLISNAAVEVDIIKNLSISVPVYYSGWNYGKSTVKFRTLTIQPEVRYYIPKARGFYVGAHFGLGHWNFATGGDWRYQDHNAETPSIGGGLGLGYALHFKKMPRLGMEFSIGAGAYNARYDVLYNEMNGPYHKRDQRTLYIGVDNVSISVTYEFDLKFRSKEGKQ